ncbi:hypothetical protein AB0L22_09225 [Micromonospora haikouensis]|uniref:hypothetical protein n=1 Tax=Micromonospora haikouensis TaxID=686309 RepID=UPI003446CA05
MDFAAIAQYLVTRADQHADNAADAYQRGDHATAEKQAAARQVYDDLAAVAGIASAVTSTGR